MASAIQNSGRWPHAGDGATRDPLEKAQNYVRILPSSSLGGMPLSEPLNLPGNSNTDSGNESSGAGRHKRNTSHVPSYIPQETLFF